MKFHVICTLPNASKHISGVAFADHKDGVVTAAPVDADTAAKFKGIPGYVIVDAEAKPPKADGAGGRGKRIKAAETLAPGEASGAAPNGDGDGGAEQKADGADGEIKDGEVDPAATPRAEQKGE